MLKNFILDFQNFQKYDIIIYIFLDIILKFQILLKNKKLEFF